MGARSRRSTRSVIAQLKNVAALPWVAHHVAVMPDVHAGQGATVGSVIAMHGAVAPAAVGVDIGCGMAAVETSLTSDDLPDDLRRLRTAIEQAIPVGRAAHREAAWESAGAELRAAGAALMEGYRARAAPVHRLGNKVACQLGTLGGGNHFIEVCLDTADTVWLMLHSGSRNIGAALAEHHMEVAQRLNHNQALEDRDLAVFLAGTPAFDAYRRDLFWAQEYARFNRELMLHLLRAGDAPLLATRWPCSRRSPATTTTSPRRCTSATSCWSRARARSAPAAGELGIIPGSMGTKSYIVRGLGNPASFESASHGAGRRMSRTEARRRFTVADLRDQTEGVECRKDHGVIDEAPKAYKNIDQVMEQQRDLVEIVAELKQVLCVKG